MDQANLCLVNENRRLQRVDGFLLPNSLGGQLSQLVIGKPEQPVGGSAVALLNGRNNPRHAAQRKHGRAKMGQDRGYIADGVAVHLAGRHSIAAASEYVPLIGRSDGPAAG